MAQAKVRIMPFSHMGLSSTPSFVGKQKASSSYVAGAPVYIDGSGYIAAMTTTASQGVSSALTTAKKSASTMLGFVAQDGLNSASKTSDVGVHVALEGMEFIGHLISATSASSNAKLAQTDLGANLPIAKHDSDTHWGICKQTSSISSASSCATGTVTRLIDAVSTVNGRVAFVIEAAFRQLGI